MNRRPSFAILNSSALNAEQGSNRLFCIDAEEFEPNVPVRQDHWARVMAEQIIQGIAFVAGVAAVAIPSVTAAFNIGRLFKAKGDHLVVEVGRQSFVIDIKSIDQTDIDVIDSATRAVEERSRLVAEERSGDNFDQANYRAA